MIESEEELAGSAGSLDKKRCAFPTVHVRPVAHGGLDTPRVLPPLPVLVVVVVLVVAVAGCCRREALLIPATSFDAVDAFSPVGHVTDSPSASRSRSTSRSCKLPMLCWWWSVAGFDLLSAWWGVSGRRAMSLMSSSSLWMQNSLALGLSLSLLTPAFIFSVWFMVTFLVALMQSLSAQYCWFAFDCV